MGIQFKKMKSIFAIASILLANYSLQTTTCVATNYCMSCDSTTANQCGSCFNWGSGSLGARSTATTSGVQHCQTARPSGLATTDCKFYSTVASTATTKSYGNCGWCKKKYLTYNASTLAEVCTDTALTGCTAVSNAEWTNCYTATSGTVSAGASVCSKGYYGSGTATNGGYPTCTKGSVSNCDWAATSTTCYFCKSKYARSTTSTCTSYTTDSNCIQLDANSACSTCWNAYYWNATTCKLAAGIMSVAFMAVAALFFN